MRLGERWALAVVVELGLGLGLALGGCGGDGEDQREAEPVEAADPRRQRAVEIMAAYFRDKEGGDGLSFSRQQAQCLADPVVDAVGIDRLVGLGMDMRAGTGPVLTEPPLTTAEAEAIQAAMIECADVVSRVANTSVFDQLSSTDAMCVAEAYFASGMARRLYFADDAHEPAIEEIAAAMNAAGESCGLDLNLVPADRPPG